MSVIYANNTELIVSSLKTLYEGLECKINSNSLGRAVLRGVVSLNIKRL